ncbi:helix-turn-helix domain-containing protein [Kribbella sp. NBC_00889]|uniref:helix-turn-helix domain-containing protein n=1 Tax=Kribbella sp. NBC_00889 TaxID=2975974 RepID=UPI003864C4F3|nr:helix-turn-helix domain-containing protein [Kribbella sp. NBC_00889]
MLSTGTSPSWTWSDVDVAVPRPSARLPGISMAGFGVRTSTFVDIAMVAHPSVTVLFDLSQAGGIVYQADGGQRQCGSFVAGLLPGRLRAGGWNGECLQIRLSPVVAASVFGASTELSGTVASLEDVWGRDAGQLEEKLRATGSWDKRFTIAADVLARRLDGRPSIDPEVAFSWRRTVAGRGRIRVDGLADEVGWSRQRLWSRFRSQIGLTPKRAAQLVRFDHAAHLLAAGHAPASTAAQSGYVDQSHLHRDVKAITGITPSAVATAPWLAIDHIAWPAHHR